MHLEKHPLPRRTFVKSAAATGAGLLFLRAANALLHREYRAGWGFNHISVAANI